METWMKRGFLQNPKSDSNPNASLASKDIIQVDHKPGAVSVANSPNMQQKPPPSIKIKIPSAPIVDDIPMVGHRPASWRGWVNMRVTQLPFHGRPYTSSLLYPGAKEAIAAIPGFPTPYTPSLRLHYRIGDAPGAGKGMFASTDLDVGDLILRERPLCLFPQYIKGDGMTSAEKMLMIIVSTITPQDRDDFFKLANCKPGNPTLGILFTNALNASRMPGDYNGRYGGVCRDLSRVNHRLVVVHRLLERLTTTIAALRTQCIDSASKT